MNFKYFFILLLLISACAEKEDSSNTNYLGVPYLSQSPTFDYISYSPGKEVGIAYTFLDVSDDTGIQTSFVNAQNELYFSQFKTPRIDNKIVVLTSMIGCGQNSDSLYPRISLSKSIEEGESKVAFLEYYLDNNLSDKYYTLKKTGPSREDVEIVLTNMEIPFVNFVQDNETGQADLIVEINDAYLKDGSLIYDHTFKNIGTKAALVKRVKYWANLNDQKDTSLDPDGSLEFTDMCLLPNQEYRIISYEVETKLGAGNAYIEVDTTNFVIESNENNNLSNSFTW